MTTYSATPGHPANGLTLSSGDYLYVSNGGIATDTTVDSGGNAVVLFGGTANDTIVHSGGAEMLGQGTTSNTTLLAGGYELVSFGGVAISTTIEAGGYAIVSSGGAASNTDNAGILVVLPGGAANGTSGSGEVVSTGVVIYQPASGITVYPNVSPDVTIDAGGGGDVLSGGTLLRGTASGGLVVDVFSGGTATATRFTGGALAEVVGGSTTGTVLDGRGQEEVLTGTATGTIVNSGGQLQVFDHATSTMVNSGGTELDRAGAAVGTTVGNGGTVYVYAGGTGSDTTVDSGGIGYVSGSGTLVDATVSSGGIVYVYSGGSASGVHVDAGGALVVFSGGNQTDNSGPVVTSGVVVDQPGVGISVYASTVTGVSLSSGGTELVLGGGTAVSTTIANGFVLLSGGTASGTDASLYGQISVGSGGDAVDTTLGLVSEMFVQSGGTASNVSIAGNLSELVIGDGATVTGAIDLAAGVLGGITIEGTVMPTAVISGFGAADEIDLSYVAYSSGGGVSYSDGTLDVTEGGQSYLLNVASSSAYASGSFVATDDGIGGTAINFFGPGSYLLSAGVTSHHLAIAGGDYLDIASGGATISATLSGTAPLLTYESSDTDGGSLLINSITVPLALESNGGTDSATTISVGGNLINTDGGVSEMATVSSGGLLFNVEGSVQGAVVDSGGIQLDFSEGATASNTAVDGGLQGVGLGATTFDSIVNAGGTQVLGGKASNGSELALFFGGVASGTTINLGGRQFVNLSASAFDTDIKAGGEMVVNSGGTAYAPTIGASGTLVLNAGAAVGSAIIFSGGQALLAIGGTALPGATMSGFAQGDVFDLKDIAPGSTPGATVDDTTDVLTIMADGGPYRLQLFGDYDGVNFEVVGDGASGSYVAEDGTALPCYAAGTRIATPAGAVAVECLAVGDLVWARDAGVASVVAVRHREVDCRRHPRPREVWPVRVRTGAFGPGQPVRDLFLSPDHAVLFDGVLIPVKYLIDGRAVTQEARERVRYWHVELARHDIVSAEGMPCESYLETGGGAAGLAWEASGCAELVVTGPRLDAARRHLRASAEAAALARAA